MPEIYPIRPDQVAEARLVIYITAHGLFHQGETLAQTIANYKTDWPLTDLDTYQQTYVEHGGTFLVTCADDGRIIGTGALKFLEAGVGELKRVWLLPEYQGQGLGYRMMRRLIDAAREQGYTCVRLETCPAYQPRAFAFYQQIGFREIPRYGDDPDDVGLELVLD
jgi:GNAT superfamily N-acetyltransferase